MEGYFEARRLSTKSEWQEMKRPGKKVATDRSFVVALSRGLDVLRAFHPNDGLLGIHRRRPNRRRHLR
jgi:hypothetical protein